MKSQNRLEGKVAIIVGAGQTPGQSIGNGRATALLFAKEGAKLFLVDRDSASVEETRKMVVEEGGVAEAFMADITQSDQCAAFAAKCMDIYGRVDILYNNVGIMSGDNFLSLLEEADWDRILEVNLKGMFLSCKHVLPIMRNQGSGAIVNVSSTGSLWSGDPYIAYNTSKAGVNGLTTAMVIECAAYGIRVNAVMPGLIRTPMGVDGPSRENSSDREALIRARDAVIPLGGKMGESEDVARAALFLASDEAKFITGAILPVDGGQLFSRSGHTHTTG
jgi:NAD(P)-dependent dehydrogenase (short-subunit alcohol dehydrogenase family)